MAELADALDLGSSGGDSVKVRILSPAPLVEDASVYWSLGAVVAQVPYTHKVTCSNHVGTTRLMHMGYSTVKKVVLSIAAAAMVARCVFVTSSNQPITASTDQAQGAPDDSWRSCVTGDEYTRTMASLLCLLTLMVPTV